jgi:hypothetical protein
MNGIGQRKNRFPRVRKQFECSYSEQAVLARVYECLLPEVRLALPQHPQNVDSYGKIGYVFDQRQQAQAMGA